MTAAGAVVRHSPFGIAPGGEAVRLWTITDDASGITIAISEWGATIQSVRTPDRNGRSGEIALGFPDHASYVAPEYVAARPYFGATIGRFANRIAGGRFVLDGIEHTIPANEGGNALHGGVRGFDRECWAGVEIDGGVRMSRTSPAGEQGFPGELSVVVEFRLDANTLRIAYEARTDALTVVNLTNHSYWNLDGAGSTTVLDHVLQVESDTYLPIDEHLLPIGTLEPVQGSPFDLRRPTMLRSVLAADHIQLSRAGGLDHSFVLRPPAAIGGRAAVVLRSPATGRSIAITTTEPAAQIYSGNALDGTLRGHGGRAYGSRSALAIEPQHFPDSPNRRTFPSTALAPGEVFRSWTSYRFGLD
jgi:aldose 1-epimerase